MTIRLSLPAQPTSVSELSTRVANAGGMISGIDVTSSGEDRIGVDITCAASGEAHAKEILEHLESLPDVKIDRVSDRAFLTHLGGKLTTSSKVPLKTRDDLSLAYTPGVGRVCEAIAKHPEEARNLTIKGNLVAVVTDGTAILGLGDLGPLAAMPVMEGKAVLFKRFADIDAFPICLDTQDTEEIIQVVKAIAPNFAGINLEDIAAPRCFEIERRLQDELDIPVFHDDQHGTAIVVLAAVLNALKVVKKDITQVRLAMSGAGAAGTAILKLLKEAGMQHMVVSDSKGIIHKDRDNLRDDHQWILDNTNEEGLTGSVQDSLKGADLFIGVSVGGLLTGDDIAHMNDDAIVLALANPDPEVDPVEAAEHAAVVATGRSDFANQINNVLVFPGVFRGLLDSRASHVTVPVMLAAAEALAAVVKDDQRNPAYIIPSVFHEDLSATVATAVADAAAQDWENTGAPKDLSNKPSVPHSARNPEKDPEKYSDIDM